MPMFVPDAQMGTGKFREFVLGLRARMRTQSTKVVHKGLVPFVFVSLFVLQLGHAPVVRIEL